MSQKNEIDNKEKDTNVPPPIQEDQKSVDSKEEDVEDQLKKKFNVWTKRYKSN